MADQWLQTTRKFSQAGMGLRSTCVDVAAAYLVSVGLCFAVLGFGPMFGTVSLSPHVTAALAAHNKLVPVPLSVDTALAQQQRVLIAQVDLAASRFQLEAKRCCFC